MDLSKLIDPREWLNVLGDWIKAGVGLRVLAFGASGVGKTTLWHYLQHNRPLETAVKTETANQLGRFRLRDVRLAGLQVAIRAVDLPGDTDKRKLWGSTFAEVKPQATVFMLDHAAGGEERKVSTARLREHETAFADLVNVLLGHREIAEKCRQMLILVNKMDLWQHELTMNDLITRSGIPQHYPRLAELGTQITARSCSAKYGDNIKSGFEWITGR